MNEIILAIVALVGGFVGGSGFKTLVDFLTKRKELEAAAAQKAKAEKDKETQDIVQLHSDIISQLRGEIHHLRNEMNTKILEYEKRLHEANVQHQACLAENAKLDVKVVGMEAEIRQLQSRLATLSTGGGTAQVTVDEAGVIRVWNQEATEIFGWSPSEALTKPVSFIIPAEYHEAHEAAFQRWKSQDRPPRNQPLVFRGQNKWGEVFPIDVSLSGWKDISGHWYVTATMRRRHEKFE